MSAPEQRWVLVPREPSDQMFAMGQRQAEECTDDFTCRSACIPEHVYQTMLSAAPKPSEGDLERAARAAYEWGRSVYTDFPWAAFNTAERREHVNRLRAALDALGGGA